MQGIDFIEGPNAKSCDFCGTDTNLHDHAHKDCSLVLCTLCATELVDNDQELDKLSKERCSSGKRRLRSQKG